MEKEFGAKSNTVYTVETNFPNTDNSEEKNNSFHAYAHHAYTHVDDPADEARKMLINTHEELFRNGLVRRETLSYDTVEQAIAVANFLKLYGRLCAGWSRESQEQYRVKYRHPLKVRVVEEHTFTARRLIDIDIAPPKSEYEIELEALKEKHGVK